MNRILLVLGAVAFLLGGGILLQSLLEASPAATPGATATTSLFIKVLLGVVALGLVIAFFAWIASLIGGATWTMPAIPKWVIAVALAILALATMNYWMMLLPGELQLRLTLLKSGILENLTLALLLIGFPLLFLTNVKARIAGGALVLVAVMMFLFTPYDHLGRSRTEVAQAWINSPSAPPAPSAYQQAALPQAVPVAPNCNIYRQDHFYPAHKPATKTNPGGVCALALFIEGHCVKFTQNYNERTAGQICVKGGVITAYDMQGNVIGMPEDVDRVWSSGAAFKGSIGFWQPRNTSLFSWR